MGRDLRIDLDVTVHGYTCFERLYQYFFPGKVPCASCWHQALETNQLTRYFSIAAAALQRLLTCLPGLQFVNGCIVSRAAISCFCMGRISQTCLWAYPGCHAVYICVCFGYIAGYGACTGCGQRQINCGKNGTDDDLSITDTVQHWQLEQ